MKEENKLYQKTIIIFMICFFTLLFWTCGQLNKNKESINNNLQLTVYNGWGDVYNINVDSVGNVASINELWKESTVRITYKLTKCDIDSINILITNILTANLDSIYEENCADCGYYILYINLRKKTFKIKVDNLYNKKSELEHSNHLVEYLTKINYEQLKTIR